MSRAEEMLPSNRYREDSGRSDYSHGSTYTDDRGNTFMDDHINGVDWHIPNKD